MPRIDYSIDIPLSPKCTWDLMTDLNLRPYWDESILEVQRGKLHHQRDLEGLSYNCLLYTSDAADE